MEKAITVIFVLSFFMSVPLTFERICIFGFMIVHYDCSLQLIHITLSKGRYDILFFRLGDTLRSVSWILAEFYFNRGLQRLYTGTCIILQKTINGFLCLLIVLFCLFEGRD